MRQVRSVVTQVERSPGRLFAGVGVLLIGAYVLALTVFPRPNGRTLNGDAIQYYAYLRSLVFDRDVDFRNEYAVLYRPTRPDEQDNVWLTARTSTGRAPNMMSIGPALLWLPIFLVTCAAVGLLRLGGLDVPLDGFAMPFPLSAGVAGIVYATAGAYLAYRVVARLYPPLQALWATLVAWLATPAIYYSLVSPAYSHATSLFAVSLFALAWYETREDTRLRRSALLGVVGGLATLVRWQDLVIFALPGVELSRRVARGEWRVGRAARHVAMMGGFAAAVMVPQFLAWQRIYGAPLLLPQGADFMRWTEPAVWQVLFSTRHGLFLWTPAVLPAVVGLWFVGRRDPIVGWGAAAAVLLSVYVNACVRDWWAGEAFGARRFVGDTVFFALGFAAVFDAMQRPSSTRPGLVRTVAAALIVYNLLFLLQYQLFMRGYRELAPYPSTMRQIFLDRVTLPWRIVRTWLAG